MNWMPTLIAWIDFALTYIACPLIVVACFAAAAAGGSDEEFPGRDFAGETAVARTGEPGTLSFPLIDVGGLSYGSSGKLAFACDCGCIGRES